MKDRVRTRKTPEPETSGTKRKPAKKALNESEERFKQIIENTKAGYFRIDLEGRFQQVNDAWLQIHGYSSQDEIIDKHFSVTQVESDLEKAKKTVERLLSGEAFPSGEFSRRCKDGSVGYHTFSASPLKKSGKVIGFEGFLIDITERREAEDKLRDTFAYTRCLIETSLDPLVTISADGKITDVNEATVRITGVSRENLIGTDFADYFTEPEKARDGYQLVFSKATVTDYPLTIRHMDGKLTDVLYNATVYKDAVGNIAGVFAAARDVTERKRLEEILKKERQELKLIIDSSPIIVFYKDTEGKFIRVNKTFADAIKLPEEELVGKTVFDLYSVKIAQGMTNDDQEVLKSRRPKINIIEQYESASGIRWVQTDKIPICDKNGVPFGLIGFAQDITERKKAEEEREKLINELRDALAKVKQLSGMLPICASCKKIRDDKGYWRQVEVYISEHTDTLFSHGMCPDCAKKAYEELKILKKREEQ